ncbi:MAG: molybdopterin-dependent oxidoreductase [Pyrinomonadaceae bacterium]
MKTNRYLIYVLLCITFAASSGCFWSSDSDVVLQLENQNGESLSLSAMDLTGLPRIAVDATDKSGVTSRYTGVELTNVLRLAKAPSGDALRGKSVSDYVIVEGADGYQASFTLAELDPDFSDLTVILADERNGQPLSGEEGKLRLVVPSETKRQARWVRQVVKMQIRSVE